MRPPVHPRRTFLPPRTLRTPRRAEREENTPVMTRCSPPRACLVLSSVSRAPLGGLGALCGKKAPSRARCCPSEKGSGAAWTKISAGSSLQRRGAGHACAVDGRYLLTSEPARRAHHRRQDG